MFGSLAQIGQLRGSPAVDVLIKADGGEAE
jgi:hypothetical protein